MRPNGRLIVAVVLLLAVAVGAGYWFGQQTANVPASDIAATQPKNGERKLLYYRNPMGLPDTSPVPKKDSMGMDYIPVYEGEAPAAAEGGIQIDTAKIQRLGVRTAAASMRTLDREVRAVGRIEVDERRMYAITPKFEGYVERLYVNATGQAVAKGQPLFEVYSPELVSAQREYALAVQGMQTLEGSSDEVQRGMNALAESALRRLRNWDISDAQIKALSQGDDARRTLAFHSPVTGIVSEKKAVQGMRFMAGETLYQIADLSSVWVLADVYEQDVGLVKQGAKALVEVGAYPGQRFEGTVSYVYPTLTAETRTVPVRIELQNPKRLLKPGMYAQVALASGAPQSMLVIPNSAVIDSGTRRMALVEVGEGRYEPREVQLGARDGEYVQVLSGVREGEPVVIAANFLIDAESNLQAAIGGFGGGRTQSDAASAESTVGHRAEGEVQAINGSAGSLTLTHGAIPALKWPPMTMKFTVANKSLLQGLQPGQRVQFEFVERQPGEWVVTRITPAGAPNSAHAEH